MLPMRVVLTGASGCLGRTLALRLCREGHEVAALVRSRERAADALGADVARLDDATRLPAACDAVVHVAPGRPGGRRDADVAALARGVRAGAIVEVGEAGALATVRGAGPAAGADARGRPGAQPVIAGPPPARVATVRLGLVLAPGGGVLERIAPLARIGLAGRLVEGPVRWIHVDDALADLLDHDAGVVIEPAGAPPPAPYLRERPPRYRLRQTTWIARPIDEVFAFFARPENLGCMTPPSLRFTITGRSAPGMSRDLELRDALRLGPVPIGWTTRIERWEPGRAFVDTQTRGPYRCWWHEHRFEAHGDVTRMDDVVLYTPRGGPPAQRVYVAPALRKIFAYRHWAIGQRFGLADPPAAPGPRDRPVAARPA